MRMVHRDSAAPSRAIVRPVEWVALLCMLVVVCTLALRGVHRTPLRSAPSLAGAHVAQHAAPSLPGLYSQDGSATMAAQNAAGLHQYWQVGMEAGPEASQAIGIQTSITTQLPEAVAPGTTDYFWIGSYLADSSFVQIGYYVPWYAQDSAGWFYCAFTADQQSGPCVYGPLSSAGNDGQTHTYTLEADSSTGGQLVNELAADGQSPSVVWNAEVDGSSVGQFVWTSGTTGSNSPSIYAESSGFAPHPATSQIGPVDFPGLVQTLTSTGAAYMTALHMRPVYADGDICPPYGASTDGSGGALLGSGLTCPNDDAWLW
jgi:hypothetical protein